MARIDTKELRERYHLLTTKGANAIADELNRLYKHEDDTKPLSREELETVLKQEGCRRKGLGVYGGNRYVTRGRKNQAVIIVHDTTVEIYGREDLIIENLPLSAVNRATLERCGVIK